MQKLKNNTSLGLLVFLALFGLSIGTFDNYRELWISTNGLTPSSISHIISVSYIVTVFVLFYFSIRISPSKLKLGVCLTLLLNMLTGTILICLNNTGYLFWLKFLMFFNIAFSQLILASAYPLMMSIQKDDELYTKKVFVESFFNKLGFLIVTILLGKTIFSRVIDYNTCLLFSVIFNFFALIVLLAIPVLNNNRNHFDITSSLKYFQKNKVIYHFLLVNMLGDLIWGACLGLPMLLLTENLQLSSALASLIILSLGILSSILAIVFLKYWRFSNDKYNLFVKFGMRIILYVLLFITGNKVILWGIIGYLLLTDQTHGYIFQSYFINNIKEEYSLFLTTLRYCTSLLGKAIGTFFCGLVFKQSLSIFILPTLIFSIIHYFLASDLIKKKENGLIND